MERLASGSHLTLAAAAVAAAACGTGGPAVRLSWIHGEDTVTAALPASAVWCADQRWLEIVGAGIDTGVAFAVMHLDSVTLGAFPVVPVSTDTGPPSPSARMAVRWFSEHDMKNFEGITGSLELSAADSFLSGDFRGRLRAPVGEDSLELAGGFRDVPLARDSLQCGSPGSDSLPADSADSVD